MAEIRNMCYTGYQGDNNYREQEQSGSVYLHQCPTPIACECSDNKATAAAVISRLRISNNGELKEI